MDAVDRRILALYQGDTRLTAESIGGQVGLSAASVQRRIKRLRGAGVVRAEVAILDSAAVGFPVTCVVLLMLEPGSERRSNWGRFMLAVRAEPRVQQCYHVTGASDAVVIVTASSMEEYLEFAQRWFEPSAGIARYETYVVLDRVKVGTSLPL